jgi:uncharacterized protein with WD repeat
MLLAVGSCFYTRTGYGAGDLKLWKLSDGADTVKLEPAFYLSVFDVTFSPDGRYLAAAIGHYQSGQNPRTYPGEVVVWDVRTGVAVNVLRGHHGCVWSVVYSPDGMRLASASGHYFGSKQGGEIKIWDSVTGQELCTFDHSHTVFGVAFSPDGRRLASAGLHGVLGRIDKAGTICIYDGTPLAETPAYQPLPDDK